MRVEGTTLVLYASLCDATVQLRLKYCQSVYSRNNAMMPRRLGTENCGSGLSVEKKIYKNDANLCQSFCTREFFFNLVIRTEFIILYRNNCVKTLNPRGPACDS